MDPLIKLTNVKKGFNGTNVLKDITLDVYPNEILGIIGSSGGGKTTLLNTIIGYYPQDSGEAVFQFKKNYLPVLDYMDLFKKKYGFASQRPSVYAKLTVFENLDYFGALYNLTKEARLTNINTLLDLVELNGARDVQARNLSGGMLRRLDIACALIHDPDILILDEPTSDLDPVLARHIWELLQKINRRGTTIIVASHHFLEIESICSRIAILTNGKIQHVGTLAELTSILSRGQEIRIETYPGNYDKIIKKLKDPLITDMENRGHEMIVQTGKPEKVLLKLMHVLNDQEEHLVDATIARLSLGDVFSHIQSK